MNKRHGILIKSDTHTVDGVCSQIWNGIEIRKKLLLHDEKIVYRDFRNDSVVVEASCNFGEHGPRAREYGFELFGRSFYGNALIIPDEERDSPEITPEEVAQMIRFFTRERDQSSVHGNFSKAEN